MNVMLSDYFKLFLHIISPKKGLTLFAGLLANNKTVFIKNYLIERFIKKYGVNMQEAALEMPADYPDFNTFFIRRLKPGVRQIAPAEVVSPADGVVSELGRIHQGQLIQAKGIDYSVDELLSCDKALSEPFHEGLFATIYLSPKDYHRIHMPIDAQLDMMIHVPGTLFSVQPLTTRHIKKLFSRNERLVVFFNTALGPMAMILVGATIVGSIGTAWQGTLPRGDEIKVTHYTPDGLYNTVFKQGDEMGYFKLGSTVIVLFGKDIPLAWDASLQAGSSIQLGEPLALLN